MAISHVSNSILPEAVQMFARFLPMSGMYFCSTSFIPERGEVADFYCCVDVVKLTATVRVLHFRRRCRLEMVGCCGSRFSHGATCGLPATTLPSVAPADVIA